jgi:hypothetical protein
MASRLPPRTAVSEGVCARAVHAALHAAKMVRAKEIDKRVIDRCAFMLLIDRPRRGIVVGCASLAARRREHAPLPGLPRLGPDVQVLPDTRPPELLTLRRVPPG